MSFAELRPAERDLARFRLRLVAAAAFVLGCFGLLGARLGWLQVVKYEELATRAENNRIAVLPVVPNRGLIVDRNGIVLANNYSAYTLEIAPARTGDLAATIDRLAELVEIQPRDRRRFFRLLEDSKRFESLPIRTKLTDDEVARFTAQRFRFPGVDIKARLFRNYPLGEVGSHVVGYIGRINAAETKQMEDNWAEEDLANYRGTDHIGKLGVEQRYEAELHGQTGFEQVETSAGGHAVRSLRTSPATPGNAVHLTIDIKLQGLVEELFGDRRGALVAIDPRNGEVLAFVSKPTFDPNLFVDGIDFDNWRALNDDPDKPLLNRALRGTYPPGSTWKPFMAMAALSTGRRTPQQAISDPGFYMFGGHRFRDDKVGGHGMVDMYKAVVQSCDTYYYVLANEMGVDGIHAAMWPLGFGHPTGIDLDGEVKGVLPSTEWKRKSYRKPEQQKWYAGETISLGIGQGYNTFTMLQLAQATSILSAGGARFQPHVVRAVERHDTRAAVPLAFPALEPMPWKPEHVEFMHKAMHGVTIEGTSARSFGSSAPYKSGGKTGTAQVIAIGKDEKYNAAKIDERHRDHALYVAYAPLESPRVALALIVENAGFGSQSAAPIARRVLDYIVLGQYPSEADIAAVRAGTATAPVGTPRSVGDVQVKGGAGDGPRDKVAFAAPSPQPSPAGGRGGTAQLLPLPRAGEGRGEGWRQ